MRFHVRFLHVDTFKTVEEWHNTWHVPHTGEFLTLADGRRFYAVVIDYQRRTPRDVDVRVTVKPLVHTDEVPADARPRG